MATENVKILCVDDEKNVLRSLQRLFIDEDYEILTALSGEEGIKLLGNTEGIQLVISDYRMPGMDGVDFLRQVHGRWPQIMRIVLSGYADTASIVGAINEGRIYRFIAKPWVDDELKASISKALEVYYLREQNEALADQLMVSNDELMMLNANLEKEIDKRTSELRFKNIAMSFSHNVIDALPVAVLGVDLSGLIVLSNRASGNLLCGDGGSLIGRSIDILPEELQTVISEISVGTQLECRVSIKGCFFKIMGGQMVTTTAQEGKIIVLLPFDTQ